MKTPVKLLIEMGPLVAFFAANYFGDPFIATAVFMVAVAIALAASWIMTRKLAAMPLVSAVFVAVFGGLTLWYQDRDFIQIKFTFINALFGAVLLGGLAFGRNYLRLLMGEALKLPETAWRTLTIRWGIFFLSLAALNEILRHALSWDHWLNFKVFGILPLTIAFAMANAPFIAKHMTEDEPKP